MTMTNPRKLAFIYLTIGCLAAATAQTSDVTVKVIGASYIEAPPNRDKNLAVFGVGSSLEKVEVHAVAISANKHFGDTLTAFQKSEVSVTAILPNKSMLPLGAAEVGSFPKISADAKSRTVSFSISRLPDQPIVGLIFEGALSTQLSKGFTKSSSRFEPRVGSSISLGDVKLSLVKVEGATISFKGDGSLSRIRHISLRQADGRVIAAERVGRMTINTEETHDWKFSSTVAPGTLDAEMYQHMEIVNIPIRVVVGRPF